MGRTKQEKRPYYKIGLANSPINSQDPFLYHKTTWRKVYERAAQASTQYDDVLLWNERDELTESCLANIVIVDKKGDQLYTPPLSCGLLGGTYRRFLIEQGKIKEKVIYRQELKGSQRVYLINSVRKWMPGLLCLDGSTS